MSLLPCCTSFESLTFLAIPKAAPAGYESLPGLELVPAELCLQAALAPALLKLRAVVLHQGVRSRPAQQLLTATALVMS